MTMMEVHEELILPNIY